MSSELDSDDETDSDTDSLCLTADIAENIDSLFDRGAVLRLHPFFDIHGSTDASTDDPLDVLHRSAEDSEESDTSPDDALSTAFAVLEHTGHTEHAERTGHTEHLDRGRRVRGMRTCCDTKDRRRTPAGTREEEGKSPARKRKHAESFLVTPYKHTKKTRRSGAVCPKKVPFFAVIESSTDGSASTDTDAEDAEDAARGNTRETRRRAARILEKIRHNAAASHR